jgi:hypothetical protein
LLSDSGSVETLALMGSTTLEAIMTLFLNVELVLYADGDRIAIVNHTMRKIKHQYIPMVLVYLTATIVAAVYFAQSNETSDYEYGNSTDEYGHEINSTYGVDYNSTGALDDGSHRGLAAAVEADSGEGSNWSTADIPYFLCSIYYVLETIMTAIRKLTFSSDKTVDIREHFVPNNIDYLIHRYARQRDYYPTGALILTLIFPPLLSTDTASGQC